MRAITPSTIRPPFALYSHGVEVPPGARLLFTSGQLGIAPDDRIPEDAEAQADLCFRAIGEILKAAGMTFADIIRINAFVADRAFLKPYMASRDRHVGSPPPASTLMIVSGFARAEFKVEVEVVAARADRSGPGPIRQKACVAHPMRSIASQAAFCLPRRRECPPDSGST